MVAARMVLVRVVASMLCKIHKVIGFKWSGGTAATAPRLHRGFSRVRVPPRPPYEMEWIQSRLVQPMWSACHWLQRPHGT